MLDAEVRPNAYAVIHLKRNLLTTHGCYVQFDDHKIHFDGIAKQYLAQVSEDVFGRTAFRRRKRRLLPNFVTLEGDGICRVFHLNILVQRPAWMSWPDFRKAFEFAYRTNAWFKQGKHSFFMEERSGDSPAYSLKTGAESLLWKSYTPTK